MYAYDELDRTIINERVEEFRDQVKRRLSGELTEDEFKMLRLQNGVYLQLHAYMFQVAIPYGTLSSQQLRALAHVARRYDRVYGHFTTRQSSCMKSSCYFTRTKPANPASRCWSGAASAERRSSRKPSSRSCTAAIS